MDLPVELGQKALEEERSDKGKDIHEEDIKYLLRVQETYRWLARNNRNWRIINCLKHSEAGGIRKKIKEISDEIWEIIEPVLTK